MAIVSFDKVGISALAACVPSRVIDNYHYDLDIWPESEVRQVVDKVGVFERRFADEKTCSSDLCFTAAERLFEDNQVDRSEIDLLVFLSQTPDYRMPATSILLQDRLGLPMSTMAFDISLGCSGFISALSIVYAMMQNHGLRKALLLDGETRSKVYSRKDRREAFIFGDAGVAALIERDERFGTSHFSINSDGSRGNLIMIPGGGYRNMSSVETLREKIVDEYGNIRTDEQGYMNGVGGGRFDPEGSLMRAMVATVLWRRESEPKPTTIKDGIIASIYLNGRVDVPYIAEQLNMSDSDVRQQIIESGLGFENPTTTEMEVSYEYLSGNVREKLRQAQENNTDGRYDANIKALERVIPMNIPAHLIEFTLGSSWVEPKLYEDFVKERTGLDVKLTNAGGTWIMSEPYYTNTEQNRAMGVIRSWS